MTPAPLYLSRVRLRARRGEAFASIAPILLAAPRDEAVANAHRIVWMLFQSRPDAGGAGDWRRDPEGQGFLWRDEGEGRYLVLSRRPPADPHDLFKIDTKDFAPALAAGDRLRIALRANPVVRLDQSEMRITAKGRTTPKRKKVDVVMHALREVPRTDWEHRTGRAFTRDGIVTDAVAGWLDRQASAYGFRRPEHAALSATNYVQVQVERRAGRRREAGRPAGISIVDIAGEIVVTDPARFLEQLPLGFGSAKAFGCGLMLIRRA